MSDTDTYRVYAIRYGHVTERQRHENFISADPHDGPMPLHFFVWVITNEQRTILVDTGFDRAEGQRRGRKVDLLPSEGLMRMGIDAAKIEDVVLTHLHYDHAGTTADFPNASFHLQDLEMRYATSRHMCQAPLAHAYSADHIKRMVDHVFSGQMEFHDGDDQIAPGVTVHHIGGHTMGLQCVRVLTGRGWVVLASDASHFYENMERTAPFPIVYNVGDMLEGYRKLRRLAESGKHIIPGHDPLVMERYPAAEPALDGIAVRLDVEPKD